MEGTQIHILTYNSIGDDIDLPWNRQSEPGIRPMKLILYPSKSPELKLYYYKLNKMGKWEQTSRKFDISVEKTRILLNNNHYSKIESAIWPYLENIYNSNDVKYPSYPFPSDGFNIENNINQVS